MRIFRFALCVACFPLVSLWADDDQKQEQQAPEEIPNFNQLDEYVYVPKSTLSLGERFVLRGPKTTYSGQGAIPSTVNPGADSTVTIPNISRTYIDGTVSPDGRTVTQTTAYGGTVDIPIQSDGKTNTWSYTNGNNALTTNYGVNSDQILPDGDIAFHTYSAEVTDTTDHQVNGMGNAGIELILDRDMGKLGKHFTWSLTGGFSISDIHSSVYAPVATTLTTLTDTYDLFGHIPPAAPYSSPNTSSQTVYNSEGVAGANSQTATQQILLGNVPLSRTEVNTDITTINRYFIEGAYYTLRVGPTVYMPISKHMKVDLSVGPMLIYAGSIFNVLSDLDIATGENFTDLYTTENNKLLPGYYVDLNLQYELTDTAGFYFGALYEGAGSYHQSVPSGTGTSYYSTTDFGSQEGFKGGMTLRF